MSEEYVEAEAGEFDAIPTRKNLFLAKISIAMLHRIIAFFPTIEELCLLPFQRSDFMAH